MPAPTLRILVTRDVFLPTATLSTVSLDLPGDGLGYLPFGFAVEDVDRHVEEDGSRKIRGSTAIPVGTYAIRLYDSPKHGVDTPELIGVPGFRHIQCHSGSGPSDTDGCLLFGLARDVELGTVARSRVACVWLKTQIVATIRAGGSVSIEITRA